MTSFERRRPRTWTLGRGVNDRSDEDICGHDFNCRPEPGSSIWDVAIDGRHAYWVGNPDTDRGRIFRVRLRDFWVEEFVPERLVSSFAIGRGGRIVYATEGEGVYAVDRPRWRSLDIGVPVRR